MATSFADTPKWFDAEYYMSQKLAQLIEADPKGNWTRESLNKNFAEAGFDNPYDHYKAFGDIENLSANTLFNNAEYLAAKAALNGSTWTIEMVAKDIHDHGMTLMEHYIQFGGKYENLNPSSEFSQDKYFEAKLDLLQTSEPDKGWTLDMVKESFANAGLTALEHFLIYGKVEGLDKFDYSVNGDPIPHPGNTKIVLTTGADTVTKDATVAELKTTDRDDVISGVVASGTKGTFNPNDVIDGGAGVDTLKIDLQSSFTAGLKDGSVKNVEKVVLDNAGGKTFNAKNIEKVELYTINASDKGGVTLTNVDSADTAYAVAMEKGKFSVSIDDAALAGKNAVVDLTLNGVGITKDDAFVTVEVKGSSANGKVAGLNLTAVGDNFVNLTKGQDTIAVDGTGNLNVVSAGGLKSFDASAATGKIVANLGNDADTVKTIKGGVADDTITVGKLLSSAVVDGGNGTDTLKFTTFADNDVIKNAITNVETFEFSTLATSPGGGDRTLTVDMTNMTGLQTIKVGGADDVNGSDTFAVKGADSNDLTLDISNKVDEVAAFKFDGSGTLNVVLTGETATGLTPGVELKALTANNATTLNITNSSELVTDVLTITDIFASAATTMNINTGDNGVTISGATAANSLSALETLTFTGFGPAEFAVSGSGTNLITVDAESLHGDLQLDLSDLTTAAGVTIDMGGAGAAALNAANASGGLTGTAKSDIFNLGSGTETVNLLSANSTYDTLNSFSSDDSIRLYNVAGTALASSVYSTSATPANLAKDKIFGFTQEDLDLTSVADDGAVEVAVRGLFKAAVSTDLHGTIAVGENFYTAIDNGDQIGIYVAKCAKLLAGGAAADADTFTGVTLVGIINGIDLADLTFVN